MIERPFIQLTCPGCGKKVYPAPLMEVATIVLKRRCKSCKTNWVINLQPLGRTLKSAMAHIATWRVNVSS